MNELFLYRISHWAYVRKIPLIPQMVKFLMILIYNSRISASCRIGKGTKLAHVGMGGVMIVSNAEIGENCLIGAGCKIIRNFPYKNVPTIGNNVFLGAGCVICGPVKIGNHVVVAPNTVVRNSIHDGDIVSGMPARVLGNVKDLDYNILENPQYKEGWMGYLKPR